ncbi:MAG TPA: hypothetical protein VIH21_00765, partial [Dehalococcoidia bacterium]
ADCYCVIATHDGGRTWRTISTAPYSLSTLVAVDADRIWGIAAFLPLDKPPTVVASADGGKTWAEQFTLERPVPTKFLLQGDRLWLYFTTTTMCFLDGPCGTPGRTLIYRRDVSADAP